MEDRFVLATVVSVLAGQSAAAAPTDLSKDIALVGEVLTAPRAVPGTDKRTHLAYEILLRNEADRPVRLDRVQARGWRVSGRL